MRPQPQPVSPPAPKPQESPENCRRVFREDQRGRRPGPSTVRTGSDGPVPYVSQAPQAVRSAYGRRWDWADSASSLTGRTLHADKCDSLGLAIQIHRLRNISRATAVRALVRYHSSPPSLVKVLSMREERILRQSVSRYESRTKTADFPRRKIESRKWGAYTSRLFLREVGIGAARSRVAHHACACVSRRFRMRK